MSFSQDFNVKVGENTRRSDLAMPRFYIHYGRQDSGAVNRPAAYAIISRLKGQSDLFLEIKSELLNLPPGNRGVAGVSFLETVQRLGLDYRHRKQTGPQNTRVFGIEISLGKHTIEEHDILAYLPDSIWRREDFYSCLPLYGARYYVPASPLDASTLDASSILDQLWQGEIAPQTQLEVFRWIGFDCINFGQMGLLSNSLTLQDLKKTLEI
ncbi:MAG TPA: hypothetical protein VF531_00065 [Bacillota bacterium]